MKNKKQCVKKKLHKMKNEVKPQKQKIAIALSVCGLSKKKKPIG